jgi:Putative zinc-finger
MSDEKTIVEISCFEVWRQISDYVDNDVAPELKARLEFHFERCKDCKAILDGTRNVVALIGDERAFEFPEGVSERLTSALSQRIASHRQGGE